MRNVNWLTIVPASDLNFKKHLKDATVDEITEALSIIADEGRKGNVTRIAALERELRKREKENMGEGEKWKMH